MNVLDWITLVCSVPGAVIVITVTVSRQTIRFTGPTAIAWYALPFLTIADIIVRHA